MTEDFKCGAVVTLGPGRKENVELMLRYLLATDAIKKPEAVMLVLDGPDVEPPTPPDLGVPVGITRLERKHEPGLEQPRNVGLRILTQRRPELNYVWFLDSDILVSPVALAHYELAWVRAQMGGLNPILIGPYDWMPDGVREPMPELYDDPRWAMFNESDLEITVSQLRVALGNFGGNLVWPVDEFARIGGFCPQLNHGRCEDGELGLRAASFRVPMMLVKAARGWHVSHPVDYERAVRLNARDVPLLNSFHPWVEGKDERSAVDMNGHQLVVTDQDGARFDYICGCGAQVNTLEMWNHLSTCGGVPEGTAPEPELILPDGFA